MNKRAFFCLALLMGWFCHDGQAQAPAATPVSLAITWPLAGESVGQIANAYGAASSTAGAITSVTMAIDGGAPSAATGTSNWLIPVYAKYLAAGSHAISFLATDVAGNTATASVQVTVVHSGPVCSHTPIGAGIYCETAATDQGTGSITIPTLTAGQLVILGVLANDRNVPWTPANINDSVGLKWKLFKNVGSGDMDQNLVQVAVYYAWVAAAASPFVPTGPDTITVNKPTSSFTLADAVVYSGVSAIDGDGGSQVGWGGPADLKYADATTGSYPVSAGDLNIAFVAGAPILPAADWIERVEDITRPFTMIVDQVATGTTANATWQMNTEGFVGIGLAFKPVVATPSLAPSPTQFSVNSETPAGIIDGTNTVFALANTPDKGSERVYVNGLRMKPVQDYTISGAVVTLGIAPAKGGTVLADYTTSARPVAALPPIAGLPTAIDSEMQICRADMATSVAMDQAVRMQPAVRDYSGEIIDCHFALYDGSNPQILGIPVMTCAAAQ